ncbi:Protein kinase domain [Trypanosoma melophagium]|uniref:Protein kinase domain n=1 Tax=Trypanosoma melophagium TaxID=715481 RepID=UPI00351A1231|nr:Protein kinase domain [Trypanosoma melophagium]
MGSAIVKIRQGVSQTQHHPSLSVDYHDSLCEGAGITHPSVEESTEDDLSHQDQSLGLVFDLYDDRMDDYELASRSLGSSNRTPASVGSTFSDSQETEITEFVSLRSPIRSACKRCGASAMKHAKFCSECATPIAGEEEVNECESQTPLSGCSGSKRKVYTRTVKILYGINSILGLGSSSTVYKAIDIKSGRPLAVKIQYINLDDEAKVWDIRRELRHLSILRHPNIVEYLGCSVERDKVSILMERLECGSLQDTFEQFPSGVPQSTVSAYTLQLLQGIAYLHSCGVTHRDIKPANLLISSDGTVKISDFGSASLAMATKSTDEPKLVGTPVYMPPEALNTIGKCGNDMLVYGKAHDIWSLGCYVHQLLTGEKPWSSLGVENAFALLLQIKTRPFVLSENLSLIARAFIVDCLQRDPLRRASASELLRHTFVTNLEDDCSSFFT